jgi:hypothetical protein
LPTKDAPDALPADAGEAGAAGLLSLPPPAYTKAAINIHKAITAIIFFFIKTPF